MPAHKLTVEVSMFINPNGKNIPERLDSIYEQLKGLDILDAFTLLDHAKNKVIESNLVVK